MPKVIIDSLVKALIDYITSHPEVIDNIVHGLIEKLASHLAAKAAAKA
jgi:hypothetical protein